MERKSIRRLGMVLLVAMFLFPTATWAMIMSPSDAEQVAANWVKEVIARYGSWGGATDAYISDGVDFTGWDGSVIGYKFSVHPKGHVVVSLLSQIAPVKSYSTDYDFNVDEGVGYPALLKDAMTGILTDLKENYGPLDQLPEEGMSPSVNQESWDWLLGVGPRPVPEKAQSEEWAPGAVMDRAAENGPDGYAGETAQISDGAPDYGWLLKSTWEQGAPYNDSCPMGDGGRTVVGCVATAAAQIANYWKYPQYGTGTYSYTWDGDDSCAGATPPYVGAGTTQSATYTDSYDWNNMLNSYSGTYTSAQSAAVAELSREMGVAFNMAYGYCASGAYTDDAVDVFPTYFRYADVPVKKDRTSYATASAWFAEIKKEFDSYLPRPVQYRIYTHSIVCDGVRPDTTNYIHLNYGWAGSYNGWYAVDNLYCPWAGCSYTEEYAITRIQPLNRLYTYVKGATSNNLYSKYSTYYGSLQLSWQNLPGATSHAPAVAVYNNRQYMAVKGATNNNIYINSRGRYFDWGAWTQVPGSTSCTPALVAFNNSLYLFVKGATSSAIYYKYMDINGTWSSSWTTVPGGATSDSPAAVVWQDKLWVFVKGATSNGIYYTYMNPDRSWEDSGGWTYRQGSGTSHAPCVVVYGDPTEVDRRIYLFQKGASTGQIYYCKSTSSFWNWDPFYVVPGGTTSTTPDAAVVPQSGSLSLAVKGASSNSVYTQGYNPIDGWPGIFTQIPGSTSDTPVQDTFYYAEPWEASSSDSTLSGGEGIAEADGTLK